MPIDSERLVELEARELDVLKQIRKHRNENSIAYFDYPNPKQLELLKAWNDVSKKVFVFSGGNRSGKTTIGAILAIATVVGYYPWNKEPVPIFHKYPRKIRYVGQDWEKHIGRVCIPALKKWWPKSRQVEIKKNHIGYETFWLDTETGSTIELMSNNQDSDLHEGWEGDLVIYDEPPRREIRIANARGLVDRNGRELFCATLLKEAWLDREVIRAVNEDGSPDTSIYTVHATIWDNVGYGLTREGVEEFSKKLTDDEKQSRLMGIPSYMTGLVYPQFKRDTHLKCRFKIPLSWPVDIAIDIHPREKQAVLFIATGPNGAKYICDELWEHGDGTAIAEAVVRLIRQREYEINQIYIDPLSKGDRNNINTVYDKVQDVFSSYGLPLRVAIKDKSAGILITKSYLLSPNNEPALFFFDDLKRTIYEIEGYMWDDDTQKPMDKDDHMMENLYRLLVVDSSPMQVYSDNEQEYTHKRVIPAHRNPITGY